MNGSKGALGAFIAALMLGVTAAHAQPSASTNLADEAEDESSNLPWRSTSLTLSQSLNVNTFDRGAQLSYDPTYAWAFIFEPHWYLTKKTHLNIDQRAYFEWTDSDSTLYAQRFMLSDTIFGVDTELYSTTLPKLGDLSFTGGAHLIAPTSIASRAASMTIGTRLRAGAVMTFKHVMDGLSVALQGRYSHRFSRHNTIELDEPSPCLSGGPNSADCQAAVDKAFSAVSSNASRFYYLGDAATNLQDAISAIISGSLQLNKEFSLDLLVWLSWARGAGLKSASITTLSQQVVEIPDHSATHWRNDRYLVLGGTWKANDWLDVGLSLIDYFPEKGPDGRNRGLLNPLDLMIGLSTSVAFDHLYLNTVGKKPRPEHAQLFLPR